MACRGDARVSNEGTSAGEGRVWGDMGWHGICWCPVATTWYVWNIVNYINHFVHKKLWLEFSYHLDAEMSWNRSSHISEDTGVVTTTLNVAHLVQHLYCIPKLRVPVIVYNPWTQMFAIFNPHFHYLHNSCWQRTRKWYSRYYFPDQGVRSLYKLYICNEQKIY